MEGMTLAVLVNGKIITEVPFKASAEIDMHKAARTNITSEKEDGIITMTVENTGAMYYVPILANAIIKAVTDVLPELNRSLITSLIKEENDVMQ